MVGEDIGFVRRLLLKGTAYKKESGGWKVMGEDNGFVRRLLLKGTVYNKEKGDGR